MVSRAPRRDFIFHQYNYLYHIKEIRDAYRIVTRLSNFPTLYLIEIYFNAPLVTRAEY